MPWVHFHVTQNGNVTPCCQAPWGEDAKLGNINESSIQEIWNGNEFESFRKQMLKGKPHQSCVRCHEKEEMGWISLREITNDKYADQMNWLALNKFKAESYSKPIYFDIRFSNICNLKCRICNFSSSSSWHSDDVALGNIDQSTPALTTSMIDEEKFYLEFKDQVGLIKEMYFAGGEPLMMEQHYHLLQFLIDAGNTSCKLFYNTNLSRLAFKDHNVLEYWKKFDYVNLAVSLDDIGNRLEYQRKNAKWETMEENFRRIKAEASNVHLMMSPTISVFNILSVAEMHTELVRKGYVRAEDVIPTLLVYPQEFNIQILRQELKVLARERLLSHIDWLEAQEVQEQKKMDYAIRQYQNIITYLNFSRDEKIRNKFHSKIQRLDELRSESFIEIFPELKIMMEI